MHRKGDHDVPAEAPQPSTACRRALALFMQILDGVILATAAALFPLSGWLTDRYGGRLVFSTAVAVFTPASALCAARPRWPSRR